MYRISHVEAIKANNKERKLAKKRKVRLVKVSAFSFSIGWDVAFAFARLPASWVGMTWPCFWKRRKRRRRRRKRKNSKRGLRLKAPRLQRRLKLAGEGQDFDKLNFFDLILVRPGKERQLTDRWRLSIRVTYRQSRSLKLSRVLCTRSSGLCNCSAVKLS